MSRLTIFVVALILTSCAGLSDPETQSTAPLAAAGSAGLSALPIDGVQPWESLDSRGYVIPGKGSSAFPAGSEFTPGADRFLEGGNVTDNGSASTIVADGGPTTMSWAIYRLPLGGVQPGALAVDANLLLDLGGAVSEYWVAVSDYGNNKWRWHGPCSDAQITVVLEAGNYLSALGNAFVAIAAHDGAQFDVVSVMLSELDGSDTTAPPMPSVPTATPVAGGIELSWTDVLAADLAGYQIYWSYSPFSAPTDNGVNALPALENTTRAVLPAAWNRDVYVALSAVDLQGNESALSPTVRGGRLNNAALQVSVSVGTPSAQRFDQVSIAASGADLYDFDTDGDGVFDITGSASNTAPVDTTATGIIRPRVRGSSSDGNAVAFGSVSLIVSGNQRPVANAQCTPQTGTAPLSVTMNGTGEDFDGTITEFAWDFDGDGIYDHNSGVDGLTAENYTAPGLYNAKLRVTDDDGAWDVDTIAVQVLDKGMLLEANPPNPEAGEQFTLTAHAPGIPDDYEWDLDGNGSYETGSMGSPTYALGVGDPGVYTYRVRATYPSGPPVLGQVDVTVRGWFNAVTDPAFSGDVSNLTMVNGHPAVTYGGFASLLYVRANDPEGRTWGTPLQIDVNSNWNSIVVHNGVPQICYFENTGELRYTRATDPDGTAWDTPTVVVQIGGASSGPLWLVIVNGNPAVAYESNVGALSYIRASNANGSAWNAALTPAPLTDWHKRMRVVDGNPAIGFYDNADLWYVRATDTDGAVWPAPVTVDTIDNAGVYCDLDVVNGRPAMTYRNPTTSQVLYLRANDAQGTSWTEINRRVIATASGSWSSFSVINGRACIAYTDSTVGAADIQFARAVDIDGNTWGSPEPLFYNGGYPRLEDLAGRPSVSYYTTGSTFAAGFSRLY